MSWTDQSDHLVEGPLGSSTKSMVLVLVYETEAVELGDAVSAFAGTTALGSLMPVKF